MKKMTPSGKQMENMESPAMQKQEAKMMAGSAYPAKPKPKPKAKPKGKSAKK